jgi:cardiolipin synthase
MPGAAAIVAYAVIAAAAIGSALHALLKKRDPRAQLGWVVACAIVPVIGAFLYWMLGVNRIKTRARRWRAAGHWDPDPDHRLDRRDAELALVDPRHADAMTSLLRLSRAVTRRPLLAGNRVAVLHNGEQAYPEMLGAIAGARSTINLSTYIFDTDPAGRRFVDALIAAGERGVAVRVLVDAIGERYARPGVSRLLRGHRNVQVARFLPLTLSLRGLRLNLRNHRKILAIDGATGFTGGMNIGRRHLVDDADNRKPTVDVHFRIDGPAVGFMEETFAADWLFTTDARTDWTGYRGPDPSGRGTALCRGVSDGPNEDFEKLQWILVGALASARERVRIMTPYFIPNRELMTGLAGAALRGVSVEIYLPWRSNLPYVDWATHAMLWEVLQHGVRIYFRPPPFSHSKLLLIDEHYAVVGSANLDPRSLRLNFEFNMEIYDPELGQTLAAHFESIREQSHETSLDEMNGRSFLTKVRDSTAKLFSPYL